MTHHRKNATEILSGTLCAPMTTPVDGFFRLIQFLDGGGWLNGGNSINSALHRCGICPSDQVGSNFSFRPHGLFQKGTVSKEARELLLIMAEEGFTGTLRYAVDGMVEEITLQDGLCLSSEDHFVKKRAYG